MIWPTCWSSVVFKNALIRFVRGVGIFWYVFVQMLQHEKGCIIISPVVPVVTGKVGDLIEWKIYWWREENWISLEHWVLWSWRLLRVKFKLNNQKGEAHYLRMRAYGGYIGVLESFVLEAMRLLESIRGKKIWSVLKTDVQEDDS